VNGYMKQASHAAGRGRNVCKRFVAMSLLALVVLPADAATQNWQGNSGTWDDVTTANWSGSAVPINGDTANLTQSSAANLSIDYTATNLTGSGLAQLTIGNTGGGTNTLNIDGTDVMLSQAINLKAGGAINQTGGTVTNSSADGSYNFIEVGGTYFMDGGREESSKRVG